MKKLILFPFILLIFISCQKFGTQFAQSQRLYKDAEVQIRKYQNLKLAQPGYGDSIKNMIIGSYLQRHEFKLIQDNFYKLGENDRPLVLLTSASWCKACLAEIPTLNKLAQEYKEELDVLVLFWDDQKGLENLMLRYKYDDLIKLVPSKTKDFENREINIAGFKHFLAYPTSYFVSKSLEIKNFDIGAAVPIEYTNHEGKKVIITEEDAYKVNYDILKAHIQALLEK